MFFSSQIKTSNCQFYMQNNFQLFFSYEKLLFKFAFISVGEKFFLINPPLFFSPQRRLGEQPHKFITPKRIPGFQEENSF